MEFTYIEEAYIDPRQKIQQKNNQDIIQDTPKQILPETQQLENPQEIKTEIVDVSTPQNEIIFCKCKKINWFNVIILLMLLYLVFKK